MTDIVEDQGAAATPSDDDEWGAAIENQYGSQDDNDKGGDDDDKAASAGAGASAGTRSDSDKGTAAKGDEEDAHGEVETGDEDDSKAADEKNQKAEYDPTIAVARRTARQLAEERAEFVKDAREKLYPDLKSELTDSEGNAIRNVQDLMRLENPVTGQAFTEEEAASFLLKAQEHLAKQNEAANQHADKVADVLMTINDESKEVAVKWGGLLNELEKTKPGFRNELLARFKKQLEIDESGVIVDFKMSPMEFYDTVLDGYDLARKALQSGDEKIAEVTHEQKKTQVKLDKARRKQDRGDITSGSNTDIRDEDEKGWDEAINTQFPDYNKSKKK